MTKTKNSGFSIQMIRKLMVAATAVALGVPAFIAMRNALVADQVSEPTEQSLARHDQSTNNYSAPQQTPAAQASIAEQPMSGTAASDSVDREIFRPVNQNVAARLSPYIETRIAADVMPLGYQRHSFVEIDTEKLQAALRSSLAASEAGNVHRYVAIPVSDGLSIDVAITSWAEGNFGVHKARGVSSIPGQAERDASFRFDAEGNTKGIVKSSDRGYVIERIGEPPYYVVFESKFVAAGM